MLKYVEGSLNTIMPLVDGGVTVVEGDLMFLDNTDNIRTNGNSTASYKAYPLEYLRTGTSVELSKAEVKSRFLGIALENKDGRTGYNSMNVSVATGGKFILDLKPPRTVYPGDFVSPSGTTINSDLLNQKVTKTTNSSIAIGTVAEHKIHAINAEIRIRTAFGAGEKI